MVKTARTLAGCVGVVTDVREEGDHNGEDSDDSWGQNLHNTEDLDEEADTGTVNSPN